MSVSGSYSQGSADSCRRRFRDAMQWRMAVLRAVHSGIRSPEYAACLKRLTCR